MIFSKLSSVALRWHQSNARHAAHLVPRPRRLEGVMRTLPFKLCVGGVYSYFAHSVISVDNGYGLVQLPNNTNA